MLSCHRHCSSSSDSGFGRSLQSLGYSFWRYNLWGGQQMYKQDWLAEVTRSFGRFRNKHGGVAEHVPGGTAEKKTPATVVLIRSKSSTQPAEEFGNSLPLPFSIWKYVSAAPSSDLITHSVPSSSKDCRLLFTTHLKLFLEHLVHTAFSGPTSHLIFLAWHSVHAWTFLDIFGTLPPISPTLT